LNFIRAYIYFDYAFEHFPCHKLESLDIKSLYEK
jgi:hypothetical protein